MKTDKKKNPILEALNQPFLGWFVPSVIIGILGLGLYKSCNNYYESKSQKELLKNEINLRINFAKKYYQICDYTILKEWSTKRESIDSLYKFTMTNIYYSNPQSEYFDSFEYNQEFNNNNLISLLIKYKNTVKNKEESEFNLIKIKEIRSYYNEHNSADSGSSHKLLSLINEMKELK